MPAQTASNSFLPLQGYMQKQAFKWVLYGPSDPYAAAVLEGQHSSSEPKRSSACRKTLLDSLDTNEGDRLPENSSRPVWKPWARAVEAQTRPLNPPLSVSSRERGPQVAPPLQSCSATNGKRSDFCNPSKAAFKTYRQ